jgi:hypothetical protein
LTARYPCASSLPDDQIDDAVWNASPLWEDFGQRTAVLLLGYPWVKEVLPFVIETANALDLAVFDWSGEQIHRADGFRELTLTVETRRPLQSPTLQQLYAAVDALTPRGGPGFLILERRGQDYAQAAGGDGAYMAEWRQYSGQKFGHWVAGLPGHSSAKGSLSQQMRRRLR